MVDVREADPNLAWLKERGLVENSQHGLTMKLDANNRCIALVGEVGKRTSCSIYENRPVGCRHYEVGGERCQKTILIEIPREAA